MKIIIRLIIMVILFGISLLLFGQGFTTYIIDTGINSLNSFVNIFTNATSGETTIESAINFVLGLVQMIGLILVYYVISYFITKLIVRK